MALFAGVVTDQLEVEGLTVNYYFNDLDGYDGPTVVLLHGTAGNAETNFAALYPMLALRRRVLTLDFVVPPTRAPFTLETYVQQATAVILEAGGGRVALVGHSLGAIVAEAIAARRPELVDSLTLISGWVKTDRSQLLRNSIWDALSVSGIEEIGDFTLFTGYSPEFIDQLPEWDYQARVERSRAMWKAPHLRRVMELNRGIDLSDEVIHIQAPTLVIAAKQDIMVPRRHQWELFGAILDSRYCEIDGGHASVQERPIELYFLINEFVGDPHATSAGATLVSEAK